MSLYDDDDPALSKAVLENDSGWAKGVNWMRKQQTNVNRKRPQGGGGGGNNATPTALPPVINLQKKKGTPSAMKKGFAFHGGGDKFRDKGCLPLNDPTWTMVNEYDPLWPNEYHKVVQELRDGKRSTTQDDLSPEDRKRRYTESGRDRARDRFYGDSSSAGTVTPGSGFSGVGTVTPGSGFAPRRVVDDYSDEDDDEDDRRRRRRRQQSEGGTRFSGSSSTSGAGTPLGGGAAIAPPPSLTETSSKDDDEEDEIPFTRKLASRPAPTGLGIAAKIMAKYGYKHGQGLGRDEQGMSQALSVEKTSKRGGRIVHERDLKPPVPPAFPPVPLFGDESLTPPQVGQDSEAEKPSITDLMKNPSKVVLCKNMVGPGEVDGELEPEVKEECHTKYGEVTRVVISELQNVAPEETVRIFIEFKRVESAIKAVVDLNGRFFGGRQVSASFYDVDKFSKGQLFN